MKIAWGVCLFVCVVCGCAHRPGFSWPVEIPGGWQRTGAEAVGGEAPEAIRQLGVKSARKARYQAGPLMAEAAAYEMTSGAGAFEASQKWRPEPATLALQANEWFVVLKLAESAGADARLKSLADEVEKLFKR